MRFFLSLLVGLAGCLSTVTEVGVSGGSGSTGVGTSAGSASAAGSATGEGSTGSATGGSSSTTGGSSTGGSALTLAQACTDWLAGGAVIETCVTKMNSLPTVQQCETTLAACTAQDLAILDAAGLCLENLVCDANFPSNFAVCTADIESVSQACLNAGRPPDGGG